MRIIVLGYIVRGPIGGMVASNVQYMVGLQRLGHDVSFLELGGQWDCCYDLQADTMTADPSYGVGFIGDLLKPYGLDEKWAYHDAFKKAWLGPLADSIDQVIGNADIVLNLCGVNDLQQGLEEVPLRVLLEEDPVFMQVKHLKEPERKSNALMHNRFFSFAYNWGKPTCTVPDDGIAWQPTRPPVVLDCWPDKAADANAERGKRYTTVMQWRSYPPVNWQGTDYHNKDHSFPPYRDLPAQAGVELEIGLAGADAKAKQELMDAGWHLANSGPISKSLPAYTDYLATSRGEFSIAKHGYVAARTGWFSERSACYLACGLPVILQDTGFSDDLPNDSSIGAFNTPDEAIAQIQRIESSYDRYRDEARELAAAYFGHDVVLSDLLERITAGPSEAQRTQRV